MRGSDYAELKAFAAVAAHGSFVRASAELGLSPSTLSQTIRDLETRLKLRLFNRTTRSVSLTAAGRRLHERFAPAMAEMEAAVRDVVHLRDRPAGLLRVHLSQLAASIFLRPVLGAFHAAYPDIVLDVTIEDAPTDIVAGGYDIGVRLGELVDQTMVAVKLCGHVRQVPVASPEYLERRGRPETPFDLKDHDCITWRQPGQAGIYNWEFVIDGEWRSIAVKGPLIVSHRDMAIAAALQGVGIAFWAEERMGTYIEQGKLVPLLDKWCGAFPGWYLCYPKQRYTPQSVRAFVDFLRQANR